MQFTIKDKQFLTYLSILVGLYILPIILADFYYLDDFYRIFYGTGWIQDGRVVTDILFKILSFDELIINISPLYQILAGICLVFSGFIIYKSFFKDEPLFSAFCCFIIVAHPFFLEALSYKYDSLNFGISFLFATISFYIVTKKENLYICFFFLICTLLSYQPNFNIFIGLVFINFINQIRLGKAPNQEFIFLLKAALIVFLVYIVYILISKPFISGWGKEHGEIIPLSIDFLPNWLMNIKRGIYRVTYFIRDPLVLFFIVPLIILTIIQIIDVGFKQSKVNLFYSFLIFLSPLILFILVFLNLIILKNPVFHARFYLGFSVLYLFILLNFTWFMEKIKWRKLKYFIVFPVLYFMTISYAYTNAQKSQDIFISNMLNYIAEDLKGLNQTSINTLVLNGSTPKSPESKIILNKYPILEKVDIFRSMFSSSFVGLYQLKRYPIFKIQSIYDSTDKEVKSKMIEFTKIKPIKSNPIYSMKILGDTALIEYKEQK